MHLIREVVRVVLPYGHIYYCGIAGDVEAPAQKDQPQKTYLGLMGHPSLMAVWLWQPRILTVFEWHR